MRVDLKKASQRLFFLAIAMLLLAFTAPTTQASRLIFLDTNVGGNGSYSALRCGDGDVNGDFLMTWDAATDTYEFFTLSRDEAAAACGYV